MAKRLRKPARILEARLDFAVDARTPHPFAHRRAELVAELHRVGQPLDDPGLTPRRREQVITAYVQALRRVFALDEEAGVE